MLIAIEILSVSAVKRLAVEQESNELGVATSNETASYKFLYWNYKLQVTSWTLNCNLLKNLPTQTLKLQVAKVFLRIELSSHMLLKLLRITEN